MLLCQKVMKIRLTNDDTADLEIIDGLCPDLLASVELGPALWEGGLEERLDITNREQNIAEICQ